MSSTGNPLETTYNTQLEPPAFSFFAEEYIEPIKVVDSNEFARKWGRFEDGAPLGGGEYFNVRVSPRDERYVLKVPTENCEPWNVAAEVVFTNRGAQKATPLRDYDRVNQPAGSRATAEVSTYQGRLIIAEPRLFGDSSIKKMIDSITGLESEDGIPSNPELTRRVVENATALMAREVYGVHRDIGAVLDFKQDGFIFKRDGTEVHGGLVDGSSMLILPPIDRLQAVAHGVDELVNFVDFVSGLDIPADKQFQLGHDISGIIIDINNALNTLRDSKDKKNIKLQATLISQNLDAFYHSYPLYRTRLRNYISRAGKSGALFQQQTPYDNSFADKILTFLTSSAWPEDDFFEQTENFTAYLAIVKDVINVLDRDVNMVRVVKDLAQNDFAGFDNLLMRAIGFQDNKALHLIAGTGQTQALDSYVPDFLIRGGLSKAIRELHTHIQSVYARIGGFSKAPEWNGGNIFRSWYLSVQDYACEDWDLFAEKYQLNRRLIQGSYDVVFYGERSEMIETKVAERRKLLKDARESKEPFSIKTLDNRLCIIDREIVGLYSDLFREKRVR